MPVSIAASKAEPSLRRSAGARFTVSPSSGKRNPLLKQAVRTRSLASFTAASGSPTSSKYGSTGAASTSTLTIKLSMPESPALYITDSISDLPKFH